MLKTAVTWSFLESWLDGVLVCKYKLIFWKFCVEIQQKSRKIYSAFSYVYFNFIARPGNNQQDLKLCRLCSSLYSHGASLHPGV